MKENKTVHTDGVKKAEKPDKKPPKKPPRKKKVKSDRQLLVSFLVKLFVVAAVVWITFSFVLCINLHYGNNMHPSVRDGDLVISFRLQKPYINAAVLYKHDGKTCVGRVIALEGNTVAIADNGELTVNGVVPSEEIFYPTFKAEGSEIQFPYTVKKGEVFILNDFRQDTEDSRAFGGVSTKDVNGPLLFTARRRGF